MVVHLSHMKRQEKHMKYLYEIPDSFWSLFRSRKREIYIEALLQINEE